MTHATRSPADVLRESRAARSLAKRRAVFRAVDEMRREGTEITFAAVARAANVSAWLVYADGMREHIDDARTAQAAEPANEERVGRNASSASLNTDLQLARQQNKKLRGEVARLEQLLREHLGGMLDEAAAVPLRRRVDELVDANRRYQDENLALATELAEARQSLIGVEEDLAACRTSLRRMIKDQSSDIQITS